MTSRGAGLPKVNDFSTLTGKAIRNMPWQRRYQAPNSSSWITTSGNSPVGYRFKSATVKGHYDAATGYRMATNYSRIIHVCTNSTDSFTFKTIPRIGGGPDPQIDEILNPIGAQGHTIVGGSMYSTTTGVVNVKSDYVQRALNEAYQSILQEKINVSVSAAELGEVLSWFASIVKRLVEALLIVKSALRGRIRSAAAHRKLKSKAWQKPPTTRRSENQRKERAYHGASATDQRWAAYNRTYAWRAETAKRFARSEARKVKTSRRTSSSKRVSSAWLEYQYALMPLVYDVYGALEVLKDGLRGDSLLFTVQRTVGGPVDPDIFVWRSYPQVVSGSVRQSARVVFAGRMHATVLSAAAELGLVNPWLVAWELVPFSFVVDWVLPIGNVLSSFTAPLGVTFVDGHLSKVVHGDYNVARIAPGGYYFQGNPPEARCKILAFQRTRYVTWPWTLFYLRSPWSYAHAATALALMRSLTK